MSDLIQKLQKGRLDPVYILSSEQPLLVERAVAAILDAAVPPAMRGFNYDAFDGKGLLASRVIAAAQTLPMMAARRMVLIRDLAPMAAAELNKLVEYVSAPSPTTVLVALSSKVDKRVKLYTAAEKQGFLHDLAPPKNQQSLVAWIADEAEARKVDMDRRACARLADVVGKDLARAALAIDQLALYAGDRAISVDDVDDLVADTRERSVFELTDAIGEGRLGRALEAVAALCDQQQSALGVVAMMARYMRQIGMYHVARSRRLSETEAARLVGGPTWMLKKLSGPARRYSADAVEIALAKLSGADRALKGQGDTVKTLGRQLGERVVLDRLVTEIVTLGR